MLNENEINNCYAELHLFQQSLRTSYIVSRSRWLSTDKRSWSFRRNWL